MREMIYPSGGADHVLSTDHMRVLAAKSHQEGRHVGHFLLPQFVFGEFAPMWLASWKRHDSTRNVFRYIQKGTPTSPEVELYAKNEIPAERYSSGTARLDGMAQDMYVAILTQFTEQRSQEVWLSRDWLAHLFNWERPDRKRLHRLREAVNKLVNTMIFRVDPATRLLTNKPQGMRLLEASRSERSGIAVTIPKTLVDVLAQNGQWSVATALDYQRIDVATAVSKRRSAQRPGLAAANQTAKLLYLLLKSQEQAGNATVKMSWVQALGKFRVDTDRPHYASVRAKSSRLHVAFSVLERLNIISGFQANDATKMITCTMHRPRKPHTLPPAQQILSFAHPATAIEAELAAAAEEAPPQPFATRAPTRGPLVTAPPTGYDGVTLSEAGCCVQPTTGDVIDLIAEIRALNVFCKGVVAVRAIDEHVYVLVNTALQRDQIERRPDSLWETLREAGVLGEGEQPLVATRNTPYTCHSAEQNMPTLDGDDER